MNKRTIGSNKELLVVEYLNNNNISVLEINFRCRTGEIDIIGRDGETYVFFEVKYRTSSEYGFASEAVDIKKQYKICRVFDYYRMINGLDDFCSFRFDVVAIDNDKIDWIKNAYEYIPRRR